MTFKVSGFIKKLSTSRRPNPAEGPSHRDFVARPVLRADHSREFSWKNENVLILGQDKGIYDLAKGISALGASVSFRFLTQLQELYQLPLEQYSTIIMTDKSDGQPCDVIEFTLNNAIRLI